MHGGEDGTGVVVWRRHARSSSSTKYTFEYEIHEENEVSPLTNASDSFLGVC